MGTVSDKELFAAYARTAPLEDLRWYLGFAERSFARYEFSADTCRIIVEMMGLEQELLNGAGTPAANKRRVWALIDRFKTSIPGWAGNAGVKGSWVDDVDSAAVYWQARAELVTFIETRQPERKRDEAITIVHPACGPISLDQIHAWHAPRAEKADALQRFRVPLRAEPLDAEQVRAAIHAAAPPTAAVYPGQEFDAEGARLRVTARRAARVAKAKASPVLPCPTCSAALANTAPNRWTCPTCRVTFGLAPVNAPKRPAQAAHKQVDWTAAGRKAWETRQRNLAAKRAAEVAA